MDEAVRHHMVGPSFQGDVIPNLATKDGIGASQIAKPGYRKGDVTKIEQESPEVAQLLDAATKKLGVHWLVMYIEPERDTRETPSDWLWKMKQHPENDWEKYRQHAHGHAKNALDDFVSGKDGGAHTHGEMDSGDGVQAPPHPENTIVYVKPTSRVHQLVAWQQLHNIGHAIWQSNKKYLSQFVQELRKMVYEMQQVQHNKDGSMPNAWEILLTIARLTDMKSYQRLFDLRQGDLNDPKKRSMTAFNNFMEGMIELIALYLKNGGKLPLKPRGEKIGGEKRVNKFGRSSYSMASPDRKGEMEPNPEIQSGDWTNAAKQRSGEFPGSSELKGQNLKALPTPTRDWAWKGMNLDQQSWDIASQKLTNIIDQAILNCTWAKKKGPVYATEGYITTNP